MNEQPQPTFLTIEAALSEIQGLGFDITEDRMRRMAREKQLPFFKEGRRLYIARDELHAHYRRKSIGSVKKVRELHGS